MTTLVASDHLLFVALAVFGPLADVAIYRKLERGIAAGSTRARSAWYSIALAIQWILSGWLAVLWIGQSRPWTDLQLGPVLPLRLSIGASLALAYLVLAALQWRAIATRPDRLARLRPKLEYAGALIPQTARDRRLFVAVAITAGICEEFLFRGFVTAYFAHWTPPFVALILAAIAFGFGHLYLGWRQVPRTAVVGLVLGLLVWMSGSLIPAMLIHAAIDLVSGDLGYRALRAPSAVA